MHYILLFAQKHVSGQTGRKAEQAAAAEAEGTISVMLSNFASFLHAVICLLLSFVFFKIKQNLVFYDPLFEDSGSVHYILLFAQKHVSGQTGRKAEQAAAAEAEGTISVMLSNFASFLHAVICLLLSFVFFRMH